MLTTPLVGGQSPASYDETKGGLIWIYHGSYSPRVWPMSIDVHAIQAGLLQHGDGLSQSVGGESNTALARSSPKFCPGVFVTRHGFLDLYQNF